MKWTTAINNYRKQIISEDSSCAICESKENLTIDHIIPIQVLNLMGIDKFTAFMYDKNFMILCKQCNQEKRSRIIRELQQTKEAIKQLFNL